jgi:hypothetical protein
VLWPLSSNLQVSVRISSDLILSVVAQEFNFLNILETTASFFVFLSEVYCGAVVFNIIVTKIMNLLILSSYSVGCVFAAFDQSE